MEALGLTQAEINDILFIKKKKTKPCWARHVHGKCLLTYYHRCSLAYYLTFLFTYYITFYEQDFGVETTDAAPYTQPRQVEDEREDNDERI